VIIETRRVYVMEQFFRAFRDEAETAADRNRKEAEQEIEYQRLAQNDQNPAHSWRDIPRDRPLF
jgi:hypothetical protein